MSNEFYRHYLPIWYMADEVIVAGLDGILFPTQAYSRETNLVIYLSSGRSASQLRIYNLHNMLLKMIFDDVTTLPYSHF
ncbi:hypothetical protein [Nitrosomonas sp.]|uniref:hypothetical protein n=1 Tax=Nitrosomonas sp. TaxID=42353 RepID=UPI0033060B24